MARALEARSPDASPPSCGTPIPRCPRAPILRSSLAASRYGGLPARLRRHRGARADHGRGAHPRGQAAASCSRSATASRSPAGDRPVARRADAQRRAPGFICRDVHLRVERPATPFSRGYNAGQVVRDFGRARRRQLGRRQWEPWHGSRPRATCSIATCSADGAARSGGVEIHNGTTNRHDRRHPQQSAATCLT